LHKGGLVQTDIQKIPLKEGLRNNGCTWGTAGVAEWLRKCAIFPKRQKKHSMIAENKENVPVNIDFP
jgi:hypothetical protein